MKNTLKVTISKELADEILRRDIERQRKNKIESLEIARNNIRGWVKFGFVKSLKLYTASDKNVCDACRQVGDKIFEIKTPEQINFVMANAQVKNCNNPVGCRCYWRPEDISP